MKPFERKQLIFSGLGDIFCIMKKLKMSNKINVKLSADLSQRLNAVAEEMGLNRSQVVRMALERYVRTEAEEQDNKPYERVKHLIGSISIGPPDLGTNRQEAKISAALSVIFPVICTALFFFLLLLTKN